MQLQIRLFARAQELAGAPSVAVDLPDQATVADLRSALGTQYPGLQPLLQHLHVAIGTDYADDSATLSESSSVTCFPPVSGG
ncbi:MAG: MoaD/ThiS family protein [Planctomycetota bacterium]|jgi:molybdopterin converting factor subunit 1